MGVGEGMTEWEYYYLDENDSEAHAGGLFQLTRADINRENPVTETVSFGSVNLDFRDGEIVGIEIWHNAEAVISEGFRKGSVHNPETFYVDREQDSRSLIDMMREKGLLNK